MSHFVRLLTGVIAGAALAYFSFHLTGILAAKIDPRTLGLTASAAYAPLMFLAWGLPAATLWMVAGFALEQRSVGLALLGASAEILIVLGLAFMQPTSERHVAELRAWAETIAWPIVFIAVLSPLGSLVGAKVRRSVLFASASESNA